MDAWRWIAWLLLGLVAVMAIAAPAFAQTPPPEEPGDDGGDVLGGIWDWAERLIDQIICALKSFVCWAIDVTWDALEPALEYALSFLPEGWVQPFTFVYELLTIANQWLPVTLSFILISAYFTFCGAFIIVKLIIKLVPFVG